MAAPFLSLLLLLMWYPSNAKPLHSCFKFWCSLSCVLTWAEGHLLRPQVTSINYLVPESETVLSVLMTRGYNCLQLHDKTLSCYEDTWTWSCSTASIHLHHWGFLWLCEHPQLCVWGKAEEHNSHTWWNQGQSGLPLWLCSKQLPKEREHGTGMNLLLYTLTASGICCPRWDKALGNQTLQAQGRQNSGNLLPALVFQYYWFLNHGISRHPTGCSVTLNSCHYWVKVRLWIVFWANNSICGLVWFIWVSDHNPDDELFFGGFYTCVDSTALSQEMNNNYTLY